MSHTEIRAGVSSGDNATIVNAAYAGNAAATANEIAPAPVFNLTPPPHAGVMAVTKRNGHREPVDLNKIVRAVARCADGLYAIDPMRVATRTISGLYDGASTRELDELSIRTAALLTAEVVAPAQHLIYDVFVADRGAKHPPASSLESNIESRIAHHG